MNLYLFDYHGTLTTLESPTVFIKSLRAVDEGCVIVVMSGGLVPPEVLAAADHFWSKAEPFRPLIQTMLNQGAGRIVISEDRPRMVRAYLRMLRSVCSDVVAVPPDQLSALLTG